MRPFPKLRPTLWDGLVLTMVAGAAVAGGAWLWTGSPAEGALTAVVSADGQEIDQIPLTDSGETTIENRGYTLHLRWTPDAVWVEEADCPTQDCVRTGRISRTGQSIVCLPARVSVRLTGGSAEDGVDAMLG